MLNNLHYDKLRHISSFFKIIADAMSTFESDYEPTDEDLRILRQWLIKMPHILQHYDDKFLATFVKGCKGSLQKTKIVLEKFNSLGLRYPEFFGHLDIYDKRLQDHLKESNYFPLPKRLDDGSFIFIIGMDIKDDSTTIKFNIFEFWRYWFMSFVVRAWENEAGNKCITLFDWRNLSLGQAKGITPVVIKRMVESLQSLPLRLKAIYHINVPPPLEWILTTSKSLLKKKLAERFYFISSMNTLYETVPRELLPKEYGGNEDDLRTLHNRWIKKVESYRDRLVKENAMMRELDLLRPKDNEPKDMVGTFKALNVD